MTGWGKNRQDFGKATFGAENGSREFYSIRSTFSEGGISFSCKFDGERRSKA